MTAFPQTDAADPLDGMDLDTLLAAAVRSRGRSPAVGDGEIDLNFEGLEACVEAFAHRLDELGFAAGETILVAAGARVATLVALFGGMRAGLRVALAPLHLEPEELADRARACDARAILAPPRYGPQAPIEAAFLAAAEAPRVRLVGALGPKGPDGSVPLDPARLPAPGEAERPRARPRQKIVTFDSVGAVREIAERTLVAAGLDLVARAGIGLDPPIYTTLAPASFAGLVAGPLASLVARAPLQLHGPFDPARFAATMGRPKPCHLVIPAALVAMLRAARLASTDRLATLLLVSRRDRARDPVPDTMPGSMGRLPPALDLHAIGEDALVAELREATGLPAPLCTEPHYIAIDGRRVLAVGLSEGPDGPVLEGAAVRGYADGTAPSADTPAPEPEPADIAFEG